VCAWSLSVFLLPVCETPPLPTHTDHWMGRITVDFNRFMDLPLSRWTGPEDAHEPGHNEQGL